MRSVWAVALAIGVLVVKTGAVYAGEPMELSEANYKEHGANKAVLMIQINWGRNWNCGAYEDAQLEKLAFRRLDKSDHGKGTTQPVTLDFKNPSRLLAKNLLQAYAYIIEPGEYALSGFDIRAARTGRDVGHFRADETQLFKDGKPLGGTFTAGANEAVYIGEFGIDCYKDPIPWRYYVEGRDEFNGFVKGFREEYPFLKSLPVSYRLFSTTIFGQPYSLDDRQ